MLLKQATRVRGGEGRGGREGGREGREGRDEGERREGRRVEATAGSGLITTGGAGMAPRAPGTDNSSGSHLVLQGWRKRGKKISHKKADLIRAQRDKLTETQDRCYRLRAGL